MIEKNISIRFLNLIQNRGAFDCLTELYLKVISNSYVIEMYQLINLINFNFIQKHLMIYH